MFYKNLMLILSSAMFINFCMAMEPRGDFNFTAGEITSLRRQKEWSAATEKLIKKWLEKKKNLILSLYKFEVPTNLEVNISTGRKNSFRHPGLSIDLEVIKQPVIRISLDSLKELSDEILDHIMAHEIGHYKQFLKKEFGYKFINKFLYSGKFSLVLIYSYLAYYSSKYDQESVQLCLIFVFLELMKLSLGNSKGMEADADIFAHKVLCDTKGAIELFKSYIKEDEAIFGSINKGFLRLFFDFLEEHPNDYKRIEIAKIIQAKLDQQGITKKDTSVTLTAKEANLSQQEVDQVFKIIGKSQPQGKLFKMHNNIDFLESI